MAYVKHTSNEIAQLFIEGAHAYPRYRLAWVERGARTVYQTKLSVKQVNWIKSVRDLENKVHDVFASVSKGFDGVIEDYQNSKRHVSWTLEIMPNGAGKLDWYFFKTQEQEAREQLGYGN